MNNLLKSLLAAFFLVSCLPCNAQSLSLLQAEQELCKIHRQMVAETSWEEAVIHEKIFYEKLTVLIRRNESLAFSFDSLKRYIHICKAGNLTLFNWQLKIHDMTTIIAQVRTADSLVVQRISNNIYDDTDFRASLTYKTIYPVLINGKTCYLAVAGGAPTGTDLQYISIEVFEFINQQLIRAKDKLLQGGETSEQFLAEGSAGVRVQVNYDEKTKLLSLLTAASENAAFELQRQWILSEGVFREKAVPKK